MDAGSANRYQGVLLTVAYDGTSFSGWARQPGVRTVEGELLGAIRELDPSVTCVRGASRTDRGVHARGQIVSFESERDIPLRGWALGLARHLPSEIGIVRVARVPAGFDPRAHVLSKTYRYLVLESQLRDPLLENRVWKVGRRLNHELMAEQAAELLGTHDFAAFRTSQDRRENTRRRILRCEVARLAADPRCLEIVVTGDGFLHHMVRIITGTLVDIGCGRIAPGAFARAFASRSRADLGVTAPPDGLYLEQVDLDQPVPEAWPEPERSVDG